MNLLKHFLLVLIFLNIPEVIVRNFGESLGSLSSYSVFLLLLIFYFFIRKKEKLNTPLLLVGLLYFLISSFQSHVESKYFFFAFVKYIIIIICGYELIKRIKTIELFIYLFVGATTVIIHSTIFPNNYGRYSGFYFNPNSAGFIAITAFSLTFSLKKKLIKSILAALTSLAGLLTFSRTFILLWLTTNIFSIKNNIKNIKLFLYGFGVILILITFKEKLKVNTDRFEQLKSLVNNDKSGAKNLTEDSRTVTWSMYYQSILNSPIFGNGYGYFQGGFVAFVGVHNSFLLILGEAGILPFLIFLIYFLYLMYSSFKIFKEAPHLFMMTVSLIAVLMADHGFFTFYIFPITTMWIHHQINLCNKNDITNNMKTLTKNN